MARSRSGALWEGARGKRRGEGSRCISQSNSTTRACNVLTKSPTPTVFTPVLRIELCYHTTTHYLGLQLLLLQSRERTAAATATAASATTVGDSHTENGSFGSGISPSSPSRKENFVITGTQDLIRRRHKSHETIMELQGANMRELEWYTSCG